MGVGRFPKLKSQGKEREARMRVLFSCVNERKFAVLNTTISYFNYLTYFLL